MANGLYDKARRGFLDGDIKWSTDDIKCLLIDIGQYTADLAVDECLSEVPVAAIISTSDLLTGKTSFGGVADANDALFSIVTGNSIEALVIYSDTGVAETSRLIAYIDSGAGLPIIPNGGDIIIQWGNSANKIFKL